MAKARNQLPTNVAYYWRNRDAEIARVRIRQDATRDMLRAWRDVPCADCERKFEPHQMDFDHRDPSTKLFGLTTGRAMLMSVVKLRAEAAKCDVVCANCHMMRTAERWRGRQRTGNYSNPSGFRRMLLWREQRDLLSRLRDVPCADCSERCPVAAMQFDHRDPTTKQSTVSRMLLRNSTEDILVEVAKCDVVCANCHRMRTYSRVHSERE